MAELEAPADAFDALATAPTFDGAATGVPEVPAEDWILAAFTMMAADTLTWPEERMPASPASTVPDGAIRFTLPGSTLANVAKTPIPLPVAKPARSFCTSALCGLINTRVGGAEYTVFEPLPAAMLPKVDQIISSPPRRVKIREVPTSTLPEA